MKKTIPTDSDDFAIDVFRGQRGGSGGGGSPAQTRLNLIQSGLYINVYPGVEEMAVIDGWRSGVSLQWAGKAGKPETIRLRSGEGLGFTVRKKPNQRPHVCIPTSHVRSVRWKNTPISVAVESWIEDGEVVVRVPGVLFEEGADD